MKLIKQLINTDKKRTVLFLLIFHFIFLLSYRKAFGICTDCVIGHNWDWSFPALDFYFKRIYEISIFTWFRYNLGSGLFLNVSHLVPNSIVSLFGHIISPKWSIILTLYLVHLSSFIFFKRLLDHFTTKKSSNFIISFLYAFSPFLFNEIIGGSWYMWISYAAIPLFFTSLHEYIQKGKSSSLTAFIISSFFVIPSLQNTVLIEAIFFCFLFFELWHSTSRQVLLFRYVGAHILLLGFNLYWILPFLTSLFSLLAYTSRPEFHGNFNSLIYLTQNIVGIISLSGYLDRNMYQFLFSKNGMLIWYGFIFATWTILLISIQKKLIKDKYFYFFLSIFILSIMIVKGGLQPFSKFTILLFKHVPLFSLYRSPQHLMLAPAFLVPLLFGYLFHSFQVKKSYLLSLILFISSIVWISGWITNGDLGKKTLASQKKDHIDFYQLSPDFKNALTDNESSSPYYRTLFLPSVLSPQYLDTEYQDKAQGGQAEFMLLHSPTFSSEISEAGKTIDDYFCFGRERQGFSLPHYLSLYNIKTIILRDDVLPKHTECAEDGDWQPDQVKSQLDQLVLNQNLKVIKPGKEYELDSKHLSSKIIATTAASYREESSLELEKSLGNQSSQESLILLHEQNQNKSLFKPTHEATPSAQFEMLNPTKYTVQLSTQGNTFLLAFHESYSSHWLVLPASTSRFFPFYPESLLPESEHLVFNGYGNAWIIEPEKICSQLGPDCKKNEDGSFVLNIILEFRPQRLLYLGSFLTLIISVTYVLISLNSARHSINGNEK